MLKRVFNYFFNEGGLIHTSTKKKYARRKRQKYINLKRKAEYKVMLFAEKPDPFKSLKNKVSKELKTIWEKK